jgi:hypothetical protein
MFNLGTGYQLGKVLFIWLMFVLIGLYAIKPHSKRFERMVLSRSLTSYRQIFAKLG